MIDIVYKWNIYKKYIVLLNYGKMIYIVYKWNKYKKYILLWKYGKMIYLFTNEINIKNIFYFGIMERWFILF